MRENFGHATEATTTGDMRVKFSKKKNPTACLMLAVASVFQKVSQHVSFYFDHDQYRLV